MDLAARALVERRADLAIAGGVYLEADVDFPLVFRQLNALSRSGTARPFAADADGMVPGEGVGVVVLKRRADAERDGDRIYAVIQGVGLASDGKSQGLAAPSAVGMPAPCAGPIAAPGIDPATVMLVEGHGLGVPAADRAELRALDAVFPALPHGRRTLGAVSSMIGHAMPAAGMAGLIKSALALFHRVLPPTLHAEHAAPAARGLSGPLLPSIQSARPWIHADDERRAAPGSMRSASPASMPTPCSKSTPLRLTAIDLVPSATGKPRRSSSPRADRAGLIDQVRQFSSGCKTIAGQPLLDMAYTLNSHREQRVERRASGCRRCRPSPS